MTATAYAPSSSPTDHRDGTLVIAGKGSAKVYAIQEADPVGDPNPGRVFWLECPDTPDTYEVFVAASGVAGDRCTCKAGQCRLPKCKHRTAVREAIQGGQLTPQGTR